MATEENEQVETKSRPFKYQEVFDKFPEESRNYYFKDTEPMFRVVAHNPATIDDFIPKAVKFNEDEFPNVVLSDFDDDAPAEVQREILRKYGTSHYKQQQPLVKMVLKAYKNAYRNGGKAGGEAIKQNFGTFIVKMNYDKSDGKMSKPGSSSHANVMLYEDVDPLSKIDDEYGYFEIKFEDYEE